MNVQKKDLGKSQIELTVELTAEEFKPYVKRGAEKLSQEVKIEGFRPGKAPYEILKQKIGEMSILEEAARIAVNKTLDSVIKDMDGEPVGQPQVSITKVAPDNPMEYKVTLALLPQVELGDYKDAKVKKKKVELKEEEVDHMISELRDMRASEVVAEREVREGDKVVVNIAMFLDKVPVEGGQSKETAVIIGKNYIVPGFDAKLIGAKKNESHEFSLPYPADFHMKNLAGKMVEFKVDVKEIYERKLPELDDTFAAGFGVKKITELKDNIRQSLRSQKQKEADQSTERELLEKLIGKTKFGDLPEILLDHETHTMVHELEHTIEEQGGKFADYLTSVGKTEDQLKLDMAPEAVKRVKTSLLIREVADKEKISVAPDEIEQNVAEMKKYYKDNKEVADKVDTPEYRNYVANVLTSRKVIDKLSEWNIE